ncbi:MAG: ribokinase [Verrucomicrobiota bacterium]
MSDSSPVSIAVVGSLNIDYFTKVDLLPIPGATVSSESLELFRGGKGANQAIAAARQNAEVFFFGCVGKDEEGLGYRNSLIESGIDVTYLRTADGRTGSAFIHVDPSGENMIVTAAGANGELRSMDIQAGIGTLRQCQAVLAQFETTRDAVITAARIANDASIPVVLNPSPFDAEFPWHEIRTDFLIVNEGEAETLLQFSPLDEEPSAVRQRLHECRIQTLIVTRGGDDTLIFSREDDQIVAVETLPVLPVDTVGAGDAFAGCFVARIAGGDALEDAVRAANCAGALTTLGSGAQTPVPDRSAVDQHLEHLSATS